MKVCDDEQGQGLGVLVNRLLEWVYQWVLVRHKNVILVAANGEKMRTKGEQRRRNSVVRFHRN